MKGLRLRLLLTTSPLWVMLLVGRAVANEAGETKAGLPQLDPSLFAGQIFWLVLSFAALYCLMAFVALPGVKRTQDKRQNIISQELSSATSANDAAKAMIAQYEKALLDARAQAQTTVSEITAKAARISSERQTAQQADMAARLHAAEASIRATQQNALNDIQSCAQDIADSIRSKVFGHHN